MYLGYQELERDIVQENGGGRTLQEVARSRHDQGLSPYFEQGMPPQLREKKMVEAEQAVGARITQVPRRR